MRKLFIILGLFLILSLSGQILPGIVSSQSISVPATPVLEALNFTNVSANFIESPAGTWSAAATYANGWGVATKTLTGDGWIEAEITSTAAQYVNIGLSANNTLNQQPWDYTLYANGSNYYGTNINYSDSHAEGTPTVGDKIRLKRTGTTITAEYYRSSTWTLIYSFNTASSATLYLKVESNWNGYVVNPKGYNIH